MTAISVKTIVAGSVLGAFAGALITGLKEVAKVSFQPEIKLDPACPVMETNDVVLADVFRTFIGPFYRLCPSESKEKYKTRVQEVMMMAEEILDIENKILSNEFSPTFEHRADSCARYNTMMKLARGLRKYFNSDILLQINAKIDQLGILMIDHLNNIRELTQL